MKKILLIWFLLSFTAGFAGAQDENSGKSVTKDG